MSQASIRTLKWQRQFVAIYKCFRKREGSAEKEVSELAVADEREIEKDSDLRRVLHTLQHDLIFKRLYQYANNPTSRLLTFRPYPDGQANEGKRLLNALRQAQHIDQVRTEAQALAQRYIEIPGIREGVLIFLIAHGQAEEKTAERCAFVFKCDFEAVSQVTAKQLFRQVEDAIVEQTKKGALYPYFDHGQFDESTVRVFDELGKTQYWLDFLDLGERKLERESLQGATFEQLTADHPQTAEKYTELLEKLPAVRSLEDAKRLIDPAERLSLPQLRTLTEAVIERAGEQKVRLRLGEVTISAPLDQFGRTWIIAEEGDRRYLVVKGSRLEHRTRMLTPIDLADFASLEEALADLEIRMAR